MSQDHNFLIINSFNPLSKKSGGVETFIKGIIKYAPSSITLSIVGLIGKNDPYPLHQWSTIEIDGKEIEFYPVMIEENEDIRQRIPLSFRFTWNLFKSKLDVSKFSLFFHRFEPAILYRNNKNKKYFVFHNDIHKFLSKSSEGIWAKFPFIYLWLEKAIHKYATKVLTVNTNTLAFYKNRYKRDADKYDFIPTWVDKAIFSPTADRDTLRQKVSDTYNIDNDAKWLLFVGRLQKQKNPQRLLEIINTLPENTRLLMVGDGNLRDNVENSISALNLSEKVHLLGAMHQDDICELYQASDLFLLASDFEGMPICVLESLACGLPVVSTPVGEVKLAITNGVSGEVCDTFDVPEIAEKCSTVLNNPETYNRTNCINSISEYTGEKVVERMFSFFR